MSRCLLPFVVALLLGCGGASDADPNLTAVTGKVTVDGSPLASGTITFRSKTGSNSSNAQIENGAFTLASSRSAEGALPGDYVVAIVSRDGEGEFGADGAFVPAKSNIPERYSDAETSGLTATVEEDGENHFTFELDAE